MKRQTILLSISLLILTACAGTSGIQKKLNRSCYPLTYMHDTDPVVKKDDVKLRLLGIEYDEGQFPELVTVKKDKGFFVPLVFLNFWTYNYTCRLGKKVVSENIDQFVKRSFLNESERSGIYAIEENCADYDFDVLININNFKTVGPYGKNGYIFFSPYLYSYGYKQTAGPANSDVAVSVQLIKDGSVVYEEDYIGHKTGRTLRKKYQKTGKLQEDYANSMVESLSFAFKESLEKMVQGINDYLKGLKSETVLSTSLSSINSLSVAVINKDGFSK